MHTLWRKLTYNKLEKEKLEGLILDLGGQKNAEYHNLIKGSHEIKVVNLDERYGYDLFFDLENNFPIDKESCDNVLAINVLEHIYNYENFITESNRILKKEGKIIIAVPFLYQVHPSPKDFWRFTHFSLEKILTDAGFTDVIVEPLGYGMFSAIYNQTYNIQKIKILKIAAEKFCIFLDKIYNFVKPNNYQGKMFYPLGYYVTAKK